jgi:hypothetical protein
MNGYSMKIRHRSTLIPVSIWGIERRFRQSKTIAKIVMRHQASAAFQEVLGAPFFLPLGQQFIA